jgi:hypothetical protein
MDAKRERERERERERVAGKTLSLAVQHSAQHKVKCGGGSRARIMNMQAK